MHTAAPWSSQTKYYMEGIVECSSLFLVDHSIFWGTKKLKCTLFVGYKIQHLFAFPHFKHLKHHILNMHIIYIMLFIDMLITF